MGSKCVPWYEASASLTELSPQPLTFPQIDFVLLLFCERKGTGKLMVFFFALIISFFHLNILLCFDIQPHVGQSGTEFHA